MALITRACACGHDFLFCPLTVSRARAGLLMYGTASAKSCLLDLVTRTRRTVGPLYRANRNHFFFSSNSRRFNKRFSNGRTSRKNRFATPPNYVPRVKSETRRKNLYDLTIGQSEHTFFPHDSNLPKRVSIGVNSFAVQIQ